MNCVSFMYFVCGSVFLLKIKTPLLNTTELHVVIIIVNNYERWNPAFLGNCLYKR